MTTDLDELRNRYHQSVAAFTQGNPNVQKPLWSRRGDVTLANPLGPPAKGFDGVCGVMDSAARLISQGEGYTFDTISWVETADLAYAPLERHRRTTSVDTAATCLRGEPPARALRPG
jgi:hypothetical protein